MTSGVYFLVLPNNKFYIGSALHVDSRINTHLRELCKGTHFNLYLQNAFNKYGSFETFIIPCLAESIRQTEQEAIFTSKLVCPDKLLNIAESVIPKIGKRNRYNRIWLIDPNGKIHGPIDNLTEFCRENGLDSQRPNFVAMINRHPYYTVAGWKFRAKNNTQKRISKISMRNHTKKQQDNISKGLTDRIVWFISPNGEIVGPIQNVARFCREHNLDKGAITNVINNKYNHHKGWRVREVDYNDYNVQL